MRFNALAPIVLISAVLVGCLPGNLPLPTDSGIDAAPPDAPIDDGSSADAPRDPDAEASDGGLPGTSAPAPPAEIVRSGTGGFLLRGAAVLAPSGPLVPGEVLIAGNTIRCVAADCSSDPMAASVTVIDTHATIAPGLIDAHNHATYNFLPEWVPDPPQIFGDRYDWRNNDRYRDHVRPEGEGGNSAAFVCPATKWAELRSIIHGTTTIQGQNSVPVASCLSILARNADHLHGLGYDHIQTTISGACESGLSDSARATLVMNFTRATDPTTRHVVHMGEGLAPGDGTMSTDVTREFECYDGTYRYSTSLLYASDGSPFGVATFIHATALDASELDAAIAAGAHFVWSPSSNVLLYGGTTDIGRLVSAGAVVGLGPDWTVSGSDEMLSELRFALEWARASGVSEVTTQALLEMATSGGAEALGLHASIGRLAPGLRADVAVFGRTSADPYRAVIDSRAADVVLTMIDGAALYGDLALEPATAVNGVCDALDACGRPKFLCVRHPGPGAPPRADESYEEIRSQLRAHLAAGWDHDGNAATANQPYVLGPDDLLELVDCTL